MNDTKTDINNVIKEEAMEEIKEEAMEEAKEEAVEEVRKEARAMKASTEANRQKKAERREAKAARKEANKNEAKKTRPNNLLLTVVIFGVIIGMFIFVGCYNYFSKPESIEKYMKDNGITEAYSDAPISDHTTMTMNADGNTIKIWLTIDEDAPDEELDQYKGEEGSEYLKQMGAYFLTSMKPEVRGLNGTVKVKAQQGDEKIAYAEMSYREAKKYLEEEQKKAEEEADEAEAADDATDASEEAAE